jgi:hypothetical protein
VSDNDLHDTVPKTDAPRNGQGAAMPTPAAVARRKPFRNGIIGFFVVLLVMFALGFGLLALSGSYLRLPVWAVAEAEDRLNRALGPTFPENAISIGAVEIGVDDHWVPRLRLEDTRLLHRDGSTVLILSEVRAAFSLDALLDGQVRPSRLRLSGTRIDLTREVDGSFDVAFAGLGSDRRIDSVPAFFAMIDEAFDTPVLSQLQAIDADALTLTLTDRVSGRVWDLGDGRLRLENHPDELRAEMALSLMGADGNPAQAQLTAITRKGENSARLSATVDRVHAADLAALILPLAPLAAVDGTSR